MRNRYLLLNWPFLGGLLLLVINDHCLKTSFHNEITGKLSDFAGLFIFPVFLAYVFPRIGRTAVYITAAFFIFWKLPASGFFIEYYNRYVPVQITRVTDYSDWMALAILPFSARLIQCPGRFRIPAMNAFHPMLIAIPACFTFMATSPPTSYYLRPHGDILIDKAFRMKMPAKQVLQKMNENGFTVINDSTVEETRYPAYIIKDLVVSATDTLKEVHFQLRESNGKTYVFLNSVNVNGPVKLNDWRMLKRYTKYYRKLVDKHIIEEIE